MWFLVQIAKILKRNLLLSLVILFSITFPGCENSDQQNNDTEAVVANRARTPQELSLALERGIFRVNDAWLDTGKILTGEITIKYADLDNFILGMARNGRTILIDKSVITRPKILQDLVDHELIHILAQQHGTRIQHHESHLFGIRIRNVVRWWEY